MNEIGLEYVGRRGYSHLYDLFLFGNISQYKHLLSFAHSFRLSDPPDPTHRDVSHPGLGVKHGKGVGKLGLEVGRG